MKTNTIIAVLSLALAAAGFTGCGGSAPKRIDPTGEATITTLGTVTTAEWVEIADDLTAKLLNSGAFARLPEKPVPVQISLIRNKTETANLPIARMTERMLTRLQNSGLAEVTMTTENLRGETGDPLATRHREEQEALQDMLSKVDGTHNVRESLETAAKNLIPRYTLSGTISEEYLRQGDLRQVTFTVYVVLTDTQTGRSVWQDQKQIAKQAEQADVGF